MSRDLEALLELFHAIKDASAREVEARETFYQARLEEISARFKLSKEILHQMILRKYPSWLRANTKPSSLPPKA